MFKLITFISLALAFILYSCSNAKLNIIPPNHIIYAQDFNVTPSSKDNSECLLKIKNYIITNNITNPIIIFESGVYKYSNNTWINGLPNITIRGDRETSFQCIYKGNNFVEYYPLYTKSPYISSDKHPFEYRKCPLTKNIGYNFIVIDDANNNFEKYDEILLYGYNQQIEGFPPNARYFQYLTIDKISEDTLFTKEIIKNKFEEELPDYCWGNNNSLCCGNPRVLNLSRSSFANKINISNIKFRRNPFCHFNDALTLNGKIVILDNVEVESIFVSTNKIFSFTNGLINSNIEIDKLVDTAKIINTTCVFKNTERNKSYFIGGTGVNVIYLNNIILNTGLRLSPRKLIIDSCTFFNVNSSYTNALIERYNDFFPTRSVIISNVKIDNTNNNNYIFGFHKVNILTDFTTSPNYDLLRFNNTYDQLNLVHRSVEIGKHVISDQNTIGVITNIYTTNNYFNIGINWKTKPLNRIYKVYYTPTDSVIINDLINSDTYFHTNRNSSTNSFISKLQYLKLNEHDSSH